ncbi:MAG: hypothetical protein V1811_02140 [Candidatus Micrarchaeota archaeon]
MLSVLRDFRNVMRERVEWDKNRAYHTWERHETVYSNALRLAKLNKMKLTPR